MNNSLIQGGNVTNIYLKQIQDVLKDDRRDDWLHFQAPSYILSEDTDRAKVVLKLQRSDADSIVQAGGKGVGLVDAVFRALKDELATEFPSLDHIFFKRFFINGGFDVAEGQGTDAGATAELHIENTYLSTAVFISETRSVTFSSVTAVVQAIEFYVNAERAVLRLIDWINHYIKASRPDLADRYTRELGDLVKIASYSEAIEKAKREKLPEA